MHGIDLRNTTFFLENGGGIQIDYQLPRMRENTATLPVHMQGFVGRIGLI